MECDRVKDENHDYLEQKESRLVDTQEDSSAQEEHLKIGLLSISDRSYIEGANFRINSEASKQEIDQLKHEYISIQKSIEESFKMNASNAQLSNLFDKLKIVVDKLFILNNKLLNPNTLEEKYKENNYKAYKVKSRKMAKTRSLLSVINE